MNLKELKNKIESSDKTKFSYSLSIPFSWRGYYEEVAFNIIETPSTKAELLEKVHIAYSDTFRGYKGGDYNYNDYTEVHFEQDTSCYTNGGYCKQLLEEIQDIDNETKLINLIF